MRHGYISKTSSSSSLDSLRHNRNAACGRWTLEGHVQEGEQEQRRYVRLGCKRWTCPHCGPKKAKRLRRAIITAAEEKDLSRLLTLTLDPASCSPEASIPYIRDCWNKFRTSLKRHTGASISFITVVELQKSGYAHLHILIDRFIAQNWISSAWQEVGGGKIVDIRPIDIHRIAPYLSKYLTKNMLLADFSNRQRRYTTSRNIALFVKSNAGIWTLRKMQIEFFQVLCRKHLIETIYDEHGLLQSFRTSLSESQVLESWTLFFTAFDTEEPSLDSADV